MRTELETYDAKEPRIKIVLNPKTYEQKIVRPKSLHPVTAKSCVRERRTSWRYDLL